MSRIRNIARWVVSFVLLILAAPLFVAVLGEFFIELARESGFYKDPWHRMDAAMTALSNFVGQKWFLCLLAGVLGLTVGLWFDNFLRRRDRDVALVDRMALASRAEELCRKISALAGEHAGERAVAWGQASANESPFARTGPIDGKFLERFGLRHGQEFWSIVSEAKKVISIDDHLMWHIRNGVSSPSDLNYFSQFMAKLASDLRHGGKDVLTATEVDMRLREVESHRITSGQYARELVALRSELARQKEGNQG